MRSDEAAAVGRDGARLGLVRRLDHQPAEAGSCCFAASDTEAVRAEAGSRGGEVGEFRTDEWGGKTYRAFFLREHGNGYCSCLSQPA